jgi:hypothetical protein
LVARKLADLRPPANCLKVATIPVCTIFAHWPACVL